MRAVRRWLLCELDWRLGSSRVRGGIVLWIGRVGVHAVWRRYVSELLGTVLVFPRVGWELRRLDRSNGADSVPYRDVLGIGCLGLHGVQRWDLCFGERCDELCHCERWLLRRDRGFFGTDGVPDWHHQRQRTERVRKLHSRLVRRIDRLDVVCARQRWLVRRRRRCVHPGGLLRRLRIG